MSEEKESSLSQEELKDKLKDMGVMQDEHSAQPVKKKSFLRGKAPIIFAVVVALGFWWWYTDSQQATDTVADSSLENTSTIASPYQQPSPQSGNQTADNYPAPPMYPSPYPNPHVPNYPYGPAGADQSSISGSPSESSGPPPNGRWVYPQNRRDDRFGPPPGWGPYGSPPGPGYYAPPPQYYSQPYYGPRPNWQPYRPPPIPGYFYPPPPGYTPNY